MTRRIIDHFNLKIPLRQVTLCPGLDLKAKIFGLGLGFAARGLGLAVPGVGLVGQLCGLVNVTA